MQKHGKPQCHEHQDELSIVDGEEDLVKLRRYLFALLLRLVNVNRKTYARSNKNREFTIWHTIRH